MGLKIGIDLGTTNSVVAQKTKNVEITRNNDHEELTRSVVAFAGNDFLVGKKAYGYLGKSPENTILSIKRLMGAAFNGEMTQKMIAETKKGPRAYYKHSIVQLEGGTDDAVAVVLGGKQYTPQAISAMILRELKENTQDRLGDIVSDAVITVPAYFTEKQKNATLQAAKQAGFNVLQLLSEPTAAAIAYGVGELEPGEGKMVLIYDFGGGTFDLSILNILDGNFMEMGTGGDRWLGGDDIDRALSEYIYGKICEQFSIDFSSIDDCIMNLPMKKRNKYLSDFRSLVEQTKINLSSSSTKKVDFSIEDMLEDLEGSPMDINITVTCKEMEDITRPFIQRSINLINALLEEKGYDMDMIDSILLVGGTSNIPLVKEMLVKEYGEHKIKRSKKPMLAIAEGAAILAHRLADDYVLIPEDTTPIEIPTYTSTHNLSMLVEVDGQTRFDPLLEKGTPLPISWAKRLTTTSNNQKLMLVDIYAEAEDGKKERQTIGYYAIEENLPMGSPFNFNFELNANNLINVSVCPEGKSHKNKAIILGRGNRDSRALVSINELFVRAVKETQTKESENAAINMLVEKLSEIDKIGLENLSDNQWAKLDLEVNEEYTKIAKEDKGYSAEERILSDSIRLLNTYATLIGEADKQLIMEAIRELGTGNPSEPERLTTFLKEMVYGSYGKLDESLDVKDFADGLERRPTTLAGDAAARVSDVARLRSLYQQMQSNFLSHNTAVAITQLEEAKAIMAIWNNKA